MNITFQKQIIKHPGGIDSSKTLLAVDLEKGSVVATEERRLGSNFPYPGWGIVTASREFLESSLSQDSPSGSFSPRAEGSREVSLGAQANSSGRS